VRLLIATRPFGVAEARMFASDTFDRNPGQTNTFSAPAPDVVHEPS
jgi:hypothetical protein